MKEETVWILVADGARARILSRKDDGSGLALAQESVFSHDVRRASELGTDRPGRVGESANPSHHAVTPKGDWTRRGKEEFARELADALEVKAEHGGFDRLILVAPPRMLGDLRGHLGERTRARLAGELNKDLTELGLAEIEAHLRKGKLL